jgi:hypothetical protein
VLEDVWLAGSLLEHVRPLAEVRVLPHSGVQLGEEPGDGDLVVTSAVDEDRDLLLLGKLEDFQDGRFDELRGLSRPWF